MKKTILFLIPLIYSVACKKDTVAPKIADTEITYRCEIVTTQNNVNGTFRYDTILTLYIPNAFTPNADGISDTYYVQSTNFKNFSMDIYDRWGASVFYTNDITKGWDGTLNNEKGKLEIGIYNYKINVTDKSTGGTHNYNGNVMLIR